jgi:hypothetical protein
VIDSEEQDYHERLKPVLLNRPDVVATLRVLGFRPEEFFDDSIYPLLERPLPWLCADRVDYFLRDSLACSVSTPDTVSRALAHLAVVDHLVVFTDVAVAREVVDQFAEMNRHWWASPTEAYIYNEFADALREGLRLGILDEPTLMTDDDTVLARLRGACSRLIDQKLQNIAHVPDEQLNRYAPRVAPKARWLDPPVLIGGSCLPLSGFDGDEVHDG